MSAPVYELMTAYGTHDVFRAKVAGAGALLESLGAGVFNAALSHSNQNDDERQREQAAFMNEQLRELELAKIEPSVSALRHTPVDKYASSRLAIGIGEQLAHLTKEGGLGNFSSFMSSLGGAAKSAVGSTVGRLGWKGQAALGATALGGGILASKAGNKAVQAMGREQQGPAVYGGGRFGFTPPNAVNSYGVPQQGTPL